MSLYSILSSTPEKQRENVLRMEISKSTRSKKIPYLMVMEITPICTLSCKMCYVRINQDELYKYGQILSEDCWINLAKQSMEIGTSSVTITGGECMTHPGFCKIYESIYDMGARITVLTNATLINENIVSMFKKRPPSYLEITLYGISEDTYEKVCGRGSAFNVVMRSIKLLKENNVNFDLRCTVIKDNVSDVYDMYAFGKNIEKRILFSNVIKNCHDCTNSSTINDSDNENELENQERRIAEYEGVSYKKDTIDERRFYYLRERLKDKKIVENGISCGAGNNSFCINWRGEMTPCVTFDAFKQHPISDGVLKAWQNLSKWADSVPQKVECQKCEYAEMCKHCIALHYGDTHILGKPSPRLCYKVQHGITD